MNIIEPQSKSPADSLEGSPSETEASTQPRSKHRSGALLSVLLFTLLFAITTFGVFIWLFRARRTLIWREDGLPQHYRALLYYSKYLRGILRTFLDTHKLVIPAWEWSLGEGADILETLHYYVIGEPINVLSALVPEKWLPFFFSASCLLRIYLGGLLYLRLCYVVLKRPHVVGCAAGAIVYVFTYWTIFNAARHPFFLTPLIALPALIIGVEKIIREGRWKTMTAAVFFAAISNFYFFYMLVILTVVYTAVRLLPILLKDCKKALRHLLAIFLSSLGGAMLSGIILVPMVISFLSSARRTESLPMPLLYEWFYYSHLPAILLSGQTSHWLTLGISAAAFPAVVLLFRRRGHLEMKAFYLITLIFITFPFFGRLFNGFSYPANRWNFAVGLLVAFTLTLFWEELPAISGRDAGAVFIFYSVLAGLCYAFDYSREARALGALAIGLLVLVICMIREGEGEKKMRGLLAIKQAVIVLGIMATTVSMAYYKYDPKEANYTAEMTSLKELRGIHKDEISIAAEVMRQQEDFSRLSGTQFLKNSPLTESISSTQFYWSLANPYQSEAQADFDTAEACGFQYHGYDERAALLSLASVKYYLTRSGEKTIPYGFHPIVSKDARDRDWTFYENENPLSISYGYEKCLSKEDWLALDGVEREEALTLAVVPERVEDVKLPAEELMENVKLTAAEPAEDAAFTAVGSAEGAAFTAVGSAEDAAFTAVGSAEDATLSAVETVEDVTLSASEHGEGERLGTVKVPYTAKALSEDLIISDRKIVATAPGASMELTLEGLPDAENFITFKNLHYTPTDELDLYRGTNEADPLHRWGEKEWNDLTPVRQMEIERKHRQSTLPTLTRFTMSTDNGLDQTLTFYTENWSFYTGRRTYTSNLGCSQEPCRTITIQFSGQGIYTFDEIGISCTPMGNFASRIEALRKYELTDVTFGTDTLTGLSHADRDHVKVFSIPYSKGWSATVDGAEAKLFRCNDCRIGLMMPAGDHTVTLTYRRPYALAGVLVSLLGILYTTAGCILFRKRR